MITAATRKMMIQAPVARKPSSTGKYVMSQPRDKMNRIDSTGNVCGKNMAIQRMYSGIDWIGQKIPPSMMVGKKEPMPSMAADTSSIEEK